MSGKIIGIIGGTGAQGGGLLRSLAAGKVDGYTARLINRNPASDKVAKLVAELGTDRLEVVQGDLDDVDSLVAAFAGCHGVFIVSNFWALPGPDAEIAQLKNAAEAVTKSPHLKHVVVSVLEDTRTFANAKEHLKPLAGDMLVPHFDAKGECTKLFPADKTTFVQAAFYWDNFIYFGMGPKKQEDGSVVVALPLGGAKLPGIVANDIGRAIAGVFAAGVDATKGKFIGLAGDALTGEEIAALFNKVLGVNNITFANVPYDVYASFGFPGAADLANMFHFQELEAEYFAKARDPATTKRYLPDIQSLEAWISENQDKLKPQ